MYLSDSISMKKEKQSANDQCLLLGPLSLTIQAFMGIIVIITLLVKRNKETPRRKLRVWIYDISKQGLGSLCQHFLNLLISVLKSSRVWMCLIRSMPSNQGKTTMLEHGTKYIMSLNGVDSDPEDEVEDQCYWYFLNLFSDCTIGIPILWAVLQLSEYILIKKLKFENLESGNYYNKRTKQGPLFSAFVKQFLIFLNGILITKLVVFLILTYFEGIMEFFADLVLGWTSKTKNLKIFLVMFVIPILLNCFQYYCIDNIIKIHSHRSPSTSLIGTNDIDNINYKLHFEDSTTRQPLQISNPTYQSIYSE